MGSVSRHEWLGTKTIAAPCYRDMTSGGAIAIAKQNVAGSEIGGCIAALRIDVVVARL
jgi:hypothetical protein